MTVHPLPLSTKLRTVTAERRQMKGCFS